VASGAQPTEIDEHGARHVLAAAGLGKVDVELVELLIVVAMVLALGIDAVLRRYRLPKLCAAAARRLSIFVERQQILWRFE
jgi:hypothetical protein